MAKDKVKKTKKVVDETTKGDETFEIPSDLTKLSKIELTNLGKQLKIKNYSKMSKAELTEAIKTNSEKSNIESDIQPETLSTKSKEANKKIPKETNQNVEINKSESDKPESVQDNEAVSTSEQTISFESMQRNELVKIAKELKIKNYSRLNKSELIKEISKNNQEVKTEVAEVKSAEVKPDITQDIKDLQMPELVEIAKELKIKNYSRLNKARLIKAINQFKENNKEEVKPEEKVISDIPAEAPVLTTADMIEKIGKNEEIAYSDERESKAIEEQTLSIEEQLRKEILLQPSKFAFGKTNEEYLLKDEENIVLPDLYMEEDKIVLLPVDPFKLFTYWDLNKKTLAMIQDLGLNELYLKVNDVTGIIYNGNNPNLYWFEKCLTYSKNWYIYPNNSDRNLCVELGYIINNNFYLIARSNVIYVPPRTSSSTVADTFVIVSYPKLEKRSISLDRGQASDKYVDREFTRKESPYFQLNDYKMAENFNLKKMPKKMPVFSLTEEIPEYFVKEFSMTGPQEENKTEERVNFPIPEKLTENTPAYNYEPEDYQPLINQPVINTTTEEELPYRVVADNMPNPDNRSEDLSVTEPVRNNDIVITREYIIPSTSEITRITKEIPESLISYFEYIPSFDRKNIKIDSFYYELPGENQKAIRVYYEWYEGETPYTKEYFWISDVFPQVHENIYKVSWGPTWIKEFIGGSEQIRFIGASERFLGSSDIFLGGTERFIESSGKYSGGSELYIGGSDNFMGGSEMYLGGSDRYLGGSDRYIGASESFIGSSDNFFGSSDIFFGASENLLTKSGQVMTEKDRYRL